MTTILAESISISGPELVLILALFLVVVVGFIAMMAFGCVLARKAGQGSSSALVGWIIIAVIEASVVLPRIPRIIGGARFSLVALAPAIALAVQASMYRSAKNAPH